MGSAASSRPGKVIEQEPCKSPAQAPLGYVSERAEGLERQERAPLLKPLESSHCKVPVECLGT